MAENEKNKAEELEEQEEITVSDLNKEIEKLKKENEKYYEHLQRTAAEFDNYKKRVMKEKEKIYSLAVGDVVTKYIAVLDNLDKAVVAETTDPKAKEELLNRIKKFKISKAVESVTLDADKIEEPADIVFSEAAKYRAVPVTKDGLKVNDPNLAMKNGKGKKVVLWDFGAKANIRRELLKRGVSVVTMKSNSTAEEILAQNPDGIMLSNGPGDPQDNIGIITELKKICEKNIPIFGICLGHQILALSRGAKTIKLKYGHRGANHPVKDLSTGRVYISSQNHGYAVETSTLPKGASLSFVNTNDGTCEGITYTDIPAFSIQFHPEASGGPLDLNFLFDEFISLINNPTYFKNYKAEFQVIDSVAYFSDAIKSNAKSSGK